jgi:hypothetical protein
VNNDDFVKFIHSFDDEFLIPASEISRSHSGKQECLVDNDIPMYSFDDICKNSPKLSKNLPKSTDALYYRLDGDRLTLYIIEFKFFNMDGFTSNYLLLDAVHDQLQTSGCVSDNLLNAFEKIRDNFVDSVEFSLRLKPFETLMIALPKLYEEYSSDNVSPKDFRTFLEDVDVKFIVFVHKINDIRNISSERSFPHSISNSLKSQYSRLKHAEIISGWDILEASQFDEFINRNNLANR